MRAPTFTMNPRLARRPLDPHRQLPMPYVQAVRADGSCDFSVIDGDKTVQAARDRSCGLCGVRLGKWFAFIGGPKSVEARTFGDPPMHRDCATNALTLCPHLARRRVPRREAPSVIDLGLGDGEREVITTEGWVEDKPQRWGLVITDGCRVELHDNAPVFRINKPREIRWFHYVDDLLVPEVAP